MLSREPETSWCSWDGAHFTAVTQPVWEVRDSSTSDPSGGEMRLFEKRGTPLLKHRRWCTSCERPLQRPRGRTFGARVPQPDVPVGAAGGQSPAQRRQCLAFTLFLSEFHSHSRTVWSREAVSSREATSFTTSTCPATVITALPSRDQILAVLSYDPLVDDVAEVLHFRDSRDGKRDIIYNEPIKRGVFLVLPCGTKSRRFSRARMQPIDDSDLRSSSNACPSVTAMDTYLALILGAGLAHEGRMVDETILGCVFASLQRSEQSLLCSEDLYRGGRMLGQIQKGTLKQQDGDVNAWLSSVPARRA
ncbi:hypothetical protein EYF80_046775 [Liparis tanakae]|uniref:Uncharacterized protein n=1 Tax=Liparis tanakae TaxID=230148 RepID=A0A4Z2FP77_9TELE|nr:hypothetical protein EYF80_046775 [Liparis tanakae]